MISSSSFSCRLFSLFSSPFSISLKVVEQTNPVSCPGLSNRRRLNAIGMLNLIRFHIMIKNIRIETYTTFPRHRRGLGIDGHLLELAHVAPELECTDLQEVAEEHPPLQAVLEAKPQLVIFLRLARRDPHRVELLKHVAPPRWSCYSQFSAPPVWYSMTRVSKKLRSFLRSIISLIHGNGLLAPGYRMSRPICWQRRLAMKRRYSLNIGAFRPSTPRGMVSSA